MWRKKEEIISDSKSGKSLLFDSEGTLPVKENGTSSEGLQNLVKGQYLKTEGVSKVALSSSDSIKLSDGTLFAAADMGDNHVLDAANDFFASKKSYSHSGVIPLSSGDFTAEIGVQDEVVRSYHVGLFMGDASVSYKLDASKDQTKTKILAAVGTTLKWKAADGKELSGDIIAWFGWTRQNDASTLGTNVIGKSVFLMGSVNTPLWNAHTTVARQDVDDTNLATTSTADVQKTAQDLPDVSVVTETTTLHTTSIDLEGKHRIYLQSGFNFNVGQQWRLDLSTSGIYGHSMGYGVGYEQYLPDYNARVKIDYLDNNSNNPFSAEVQKMVSREAGLSVWAFAKVNTSGKPSPIFWLSATLSFWKTSPSAMYSRSNTAVTQLANNMRSLTTNNEVIPDDPKSIGHEKTTHRDQVVSEKITKTYKAPVLTVGTPVVNSDNTVTIPVSSSIEGVTYRIQIDGGLLVDVSVAGWVITTSALSAWSHTLNIVADRVTPENQKISSEIKSLSVNISADAPTTITLDATDITTSSLLAQCNITDADGASGTCILKDASGNTIKIWTIGTDTPISGLLPNTSYTLQLTGLAITKNPNGTLSQKQIQQTKTIQTKDAENTPPTSVKFTQSIEPVVWNITPSQVIATVSCVDDGWAGNCTYSMVSSDFAVTPQGQITVQNTQISGWVYQILMVATDKKGATYEYSVSIVVKKNLIDHADEFTPPTLTPGKTSIEITWGSVSDADNSGSVTPTYTVKDALGNTVDKNTLKPNTPYTVSASYSTKNGETGQMVDKNVIVGNVTTLDLDTPPAPSVQIDDSSNTISNWNGIDPSLYEMSLDGGKIWTASSVGQNFGTGNVDVLLRKKAIGWVSYAGSIQKLVFTQDNTPGVLGVITGESIYTPGTTSGVYSVSFVDPDGILSVIAKVDGVDTLVTKNGDIYSIGLPLDMSSGNHTIEFISQWKNPDGTAELVQKELMNVTVPEKVLPIVVTPDIVQGSISGDPTMVNVLANDQAPSGKSLQLVDAEVTNGKAEISYTSDGQVTVTPSAEFLESIAPGETKTISISYAAEVAASPVARALSKTLAFARSIVTGTPLPSKCTLSIEYKRPALITPTVSFPTASVTKDVGQTYTQVLVTNSTGKISYSSGNTSIASVDANGKVTFRAPGSTVITANQSADGKYKQTTAKYTITVKAVEVYPAPVTWGSFASLSEIKFWDNGWLPIIEFDIDVSGVTDPKWWPVSVSISGLPVWLIAVYSPATQTIHLSGAYDANAIDTTRVERIPIIFTATTKGGLVNQPATLVIRDEL